MDITTVSPIDRPRVSVGLPNQLGVWYRYATHCRWWRIEGVTKRYIAGYVAPHWSSPPSLEDAKPFTINRRPGGDLIWPRSFSIGEEAYDFLQALTLRIERRQKARAR
jgi:hypothetical protein